MPVPTSIADLSTTAGSNYPAGGDAIGTSLDDYLRAVQAILAEGLKSLYTAGGTANALTVTTTPIFATLSAGMGVWVKPTSDNSGATTLNINGLGAISVYYNGVACVGGEIKNGVPIYLKYDGTVWNGSLSMSSAFSHRNKIINGKMDISQRGTSFPAIATGAYSLDRWRFTNASAAVITASQQSDVPSSLEFQNSLRLAVTTADTSIAAGDQVTCQHLLEGYNARDLIGRTFTLSFWVRSSKIGTHCVSLLNGGADRTYVADYTINAANTWEYKTITVSGGLITAGTWDWANGLGLRVSWSLAAGSTFQTTAGAWQTGAYFSTANQVNCLDTIGNIFGITGVQLEAGALATPFEHRPYGTELALCQRYYEVTTISVITGAASQSMVMTRGFSQPKRAAPTLISASSFTSNVSSINFSTLNLDAYRAVLGATAGGSAEWTGAVTASSEL